MPTMSRIKKELAKCRKRKFSLIDWAVFIPAVIAIIFAGDYSGYSALTRPTMYSVLVIWLVIKAKWELRVYSWFWLLIGSAVLFHVLLLALVPWNSGWIPALVAIPLLSADIVAWLILLILFEVRFEKRSASKRLQSQ